MTIDGGAGDDTMLGGAGPETLIGGSGDDTVDGNLGTDTRCSARGNDRFNWDPGDGNDTVDGQGNTDTLTFNGSNIGELLNVAANSGRVRFTRNMANIVMDLDGVEAIRRAPVGGADTATVTDLAGTDVKTRRLRPRRRRRPARRGRRRRPGRLHLRRRRRSSRA